MQFDLVSYLLGVLTLPLISLLIFSIKIAIDLGLDMAKRS